MQLLAYLLTHRQDNEITGGAQLNDAGSGNAIGPAAAGGIYTTVLQRLPCIAPAEVLDVDLAGQPVAVKQDLHDLGRGGALLRERYGLALQLLVGGDALIGSGDDGQHPGDEAECLAHGFHGNGGGEGCLTVQCLNEVDGAGITALQLAAVDEIDDLHGAGGHNGRGLHIGILVYHGGHCFQRGIGGAAYGISAKAQHIALGRGVIVSGGILGIAAACQNGTQHHGSQQQRESLFHFLFLRRIIFFLVCFTDPSLQSHVSGHWAENQALFVMLHKFPLNPYINRHILPHFNEAISDLFVILANFSAFLYAGFFWISSCLFSMFLFAAFLPDGTSLLPASLLPCSMVK